MTRRVDLEAVRVHLEALHHTTDVAERVAADPVAFSHRYEDRADIEIAAFVAACLAYGRVGLFRPILDRIFAHLDHLGGPAHAVRNFEPLVDGAPLAPLVYRFNLGSDVILLLRTLRVVYERHGTLEALFEPGDLRHALAGAVAELRGIAVAESAACGTPARGFESLRRGFRYFLPSPDSGSACKRLNLFLRWMVRRDGVDHGLWRAIPASDLVIPLDTHVLRISRFLGLTDRRDGSWRTAAEITGQLRILDPDDPVRFDFALSHLGISGRCVGRRVDTICAACPLDPACVAD